MGILPRMQSDVPRLVDEINLRCDSATTRKVIHTAMAKVYDLIHNGLTTTNTTDSDGSSKTEYIRLIEVCVLI